MEIKELNERQYNKLSKKIYIVLSLISDGKSSKENFDIVKKYIKNFFVSYNGLPFLHLLYNNVSYFSYQKYLLVKTIFNNLSVEEQKYLINLTDNQKNNFLYYYLKKGSCYDITMMETLLVKYASKNSLPIFDCNAKNIDGKSLGNIIIFDWFSKLVKEYKELKLKIKNHEFLNIYNFLIEETDYQYLEQDIEEIEDYLKKQRNCIDEDYIGLLVDIISNYYLSNFSKVLDELSSNSSLNFRVICEKFGYPPYKNKKVLCNPNIYNKINICNDFSIGDCYCTDYDVPNDKVLEDYDTTYFHKFNMLFYCIDKKQNQHDESMVMLNIKRLLEINVVDVNSLNKYNDDIISYAIKQGYREEFIFGLIDICLKYGYDSKKYFIKTLRAVMFSDFSKINIINFYNKLCELGFNLIEEKRILENVGMINILSLKLRDFKFDDVQTILYEDKKAKFLASIKKDLLQYLLLFNPTLQDIKDIEQLYTLYKKTLRVTPALESVFYNTFITKIVECKQNSVNINYDVSLEDLYVVFRELMEEYKNKKLTKS